MLKKILFILGIMLFLVAFYYGFLKFNDVFFSEDENLPQNNSQNQTVDSPNSEQQPVQSGFDKSKYSTDQPGSPWWVVNKTRPLPDVYVPPDLVIPDVKRRLSGTSQMQYSNQAVPDLKEMFSAASANGVTLVFGSGYRSEALQRQFYEGYVAEDGQESADHLSARPGYSEHQTGLSFDATNVSQECHLKTCFEDTPEGKWLRDNAYKYGFIIRYPDGKREITGFEYEPWHMRWVGKELSNEMHRTNIQTLEEFFGLPAAPNYL